MPKIYVDQSEMVDNTSNIYCYTDSIAGLEATSFSGEVSVREHSENDGMFEISDTATGDSIRLFSDNISKLIDCLQRLEADMFIKHAGS